jgi:3'-phosphoadenosine 5'-phosphosulfate sulfotransferase (PAPS reductase)/FAD synthetase
MKHVVCYSGGHSSALVAIEVVRKFGKENVILVNHDIHPSVEAEDIKRFKREVAAHLGLNITYVNHPQWNLKDQFDVVMDAKAFKVGRGTELCTNRLKTAPFHAWLDTFEDKSSVV